MTKVVSDARAAIALARVTGSVTATVDGVKAERLYTSTGLRYSRAGVWLVTHPDGFQTTVFEEDL